MHHHLVSAPRADPSEEERDGRPKGEPAKVPESGSGRFVVAPASGQEGAAGAITYSVQMETPLGFNLGGLAAFVDSVLQDERGWTAAGHRLVRTMNGDMRVVLATPATADRLCAPLETGGRLSCRNGADVVINAWRWVHGAEGYEGRIRDYRAYVVNHEVGHALGYRHAPCPGVGLPAPVMQQQTKGLLGCRPNAWPALVDLLEH